MITNYASNQILSSLCGKVQQISLASSSYLALSVVEPTAEGDNVHEPSEIAGYVRTRIGHYQDGGAQYMGTPVNGEITNSEEIHFNEATASWGTLRYVGIFNAKTGGTLLAWGELGSYVDGVWTPSPITPLANTVVVIKPGGMRITIR